MSGAGATPAWTGTAGFQLPMGSSLVVLLACAALLLLLAIRVLPRTGAVEDRYAARPVMTANEQEFHTRLRSALPECEAWPQTSMAALVRPAVPRGSSGHWRAFNKVASKRVDWVVARRDPGGWKLVVVELDDRTHDASADAARDRRLSQAGYATLRFDCRAKPGVAALRAAVLAAMDGGATGEQARASPPAARLPLWAGTETPTGRARPRGTTAGAVRTDAP